MMRKMLVSTMMLVSSGCMAPMADDNGDLGDDALEDGENRGVSLQALADSASVMNFHFDELAGSTVFNDLSNANADATCVAPGCPAAGGLGLRGTPKHNNARRAPRFAGDCLQMPDNPAHEITLANGGVTFSAWVYPDSLAASSTMAILSKWHTGGDNREWMLAVSTDAAGVARFTFSERSAGTTPTTYSISSNYRVVAGAWQHVGLVIDTVGGYRFYVNGAPDATGTLPSATIKHGTSATRIGCAYSGGTTYHFQGKIDEIMMAKAQATAAEMSKFYTWSRPVDPSMTFAFGEGYSAASAVNVVNADWTYNIDQWTGIPQAVRSLGRDRYKFFYRRNRACEAGGVSCHDFPKLQTLLTENDGAHGPARIEIEGDIGKGMFAYGSYQDPPDETCHAEGSTAAKWGCTVANLVRAHDNLVAWNLDDFWRSAKYENDAASFRNRERMLEFCDALPRAPDDATRPAIPVYATLYCNGGDGLDGAGEYACDIDGSNPDSRPYAEGGEWCRKTPASDGRYTGDEAFVDYLTSTDAATNERLRKCLRGVNLYIHEASAPELDKCVGHLRTLQKDDAEFQIRVGVYLHETGPNTCDRWRQNVEVARRITADGFTFFVLPSMATSCPADPAWSYGWIRNKTLDSSKFINWAQY